MRYVVLVVVVVVLATTASAWAAVAPFDTSQFYTQAEFERAIRLYTDAIARNPNDADAHYWLGVAYLYGFQFFRRGLAPYAGGFAPRAEASLQRALQLRPGTLGTVLALLELYSLVGDQVKWAAMFDRLLALTPPLPLK